MNENRKAIAKAAEEVDEAPPPMPDVDGNPFADQQGIAELAKAIGQEWRTLPASHDRAEQAMDRTEDAMPLESPFKQPTILASREDKGTQSATPEPSPAPMPEPFRQSPSLVQLAEQIRESRPSSPAPMPAEHGLSAFTDRPEMPTEAREPKTVSAPFASAPSGLPDQSSPTPQISTVERPSVDDPEMPTRQLQTDSVMAMTRLTEAMSRLADKMGSGMDRHQVQRSTRL